MEREADGQELDFNELNKDQILQQYMSISEQMGIEPHAAFI